MSLHDHRDLLVSAFHAVWDHYFQPGRGSGVLDTSARLALAEFMVEQIREGIHDEPSLAAAGLQFLFSLEDEALDQTLEEEALHEPDYDSDVPWSMRLENASARFVSVGRVAGHSAAWILERGGSHQQPRS